MLIGSIGYGRTVGASRGLRLVYSCLMSLLKPFMVTIERLSAEGLGVGHYNQKTVLVFGGLPGETLPVRVLKKRKGVIWAEIDAVMETAEPAGRTAHAGSLIGSTQDNRTQTPLEDHYVSCSPWQRVRREVQPLLKQGMLRDAFREEYAASGADAPAPSLPAITEFVDARERTGYRTKIEYSFWYTDTLHLAFHVRGKPFVCVPLPKGCALASPAMNRVALGIRDALRRLEIPKRQLKTVTVRESKTRNRRIALLCVQDASCCPKISLETIPECHGLTIAYSDPRSPTSRVDTILHREGEAFLEEDIRGASIRYPIDGFFQNNIPMFHEALERMARHISPSERLIELYCGVGTIGMAFRDIAPEIVGVELMPENAAFARINAKRNRISGYRVIESAVEKLSDPLWGTGDTVILDPPRAGMHRALTEKLLRHPPAKLLYLSCNPKTQARDTAMLAEKLRVTHLYGFDFYPNTLHMESLAVLERRG